MNAAAPLSDDLRGLYQEIILDHGKHPRNFRVAEHATCKAMGNNPMCGDRLTVTARVNNAGVIEDVAFEGRGCAISIASASMMTEALKGRPKDQAHKLSDTVKALCTGKADVESAKQDFPADLGDSLDKLAALSGVRQFPVRVKCATLPWHALMACLDGGKETTTE